MILQVGVEFALRDNPDRRWVILKIEGGVAYYTTTFYLDNPHIVGCGGKFGVHLWSETDYVEVKDGLDRILEKL